MTTKIVMAAELKTKLGRLIGELGQDGVPFYVTQHGKPRAVLVSYEEYAHGEDAKTSCHGRGPVVAGRPEGLFRGV